MHRSRMQYRIQGARMLTGGKSLFLNLPDKLQEVCQENINIEKSSFLFYISMIRLRSLCIFFLILYIIIRTDLY